MNVSLTPELDRYVAAKVKTGRYHSAGEVMLAALRLMQERDAMGEIQIMEARQKIQSGLDALAAGDYVEGTSAELYESAIRRSRQRLESRKSAHDASKV